MCGIQLWGHDIGFLTAIDTIYRVWIDNKPEQYKCSTIHYDNILLDFWLDDINYTSFIQ